MERNKHKSLLLEKKTPSIESVAGKGKCLGQLKTE